MAPENTGPTLSNASIDEILDPDDDFFNPPPLPPNPTGIQIRSGLHDRTLAAACNPYPHLMDTDEDNDNPTGAHDPNNGGLSEPYLDDETIDIWNNGILAASNAAAGPSNYSEYSPSRPQSGAANRTIT